VFERVSLIDSYGKEGFFIYEKGKPFPIKFQIILKISASYYFHKNKTELLKE